jgi:cytochrome P450
MFLVVVAAGHRLPNVFADPERFDVDRFLPPRICLGINVAQVEVTALAAHVRRHYRLSPIPGRVIRQVGGIVQTLPDGILGRIQRLR